MMGASSTEACCQCPHFELAVSETRVDGFGLEGEDAEPTLVDAMERVIPAGASGRTGS